MNCGKCRPVLKGRDHEGDYYEVELCPRHALTERLAEALRRSKKILPIEQWEASIDEENKVLAEYDATQQVAGTEEEKS